MVHLPSLDNGLAFLLRSMEAAIGAVERWAFFRLIFDWVDEEISVFRDNLLGAMAEWVGGVAFVLLTLWVLLQGYRIVTGQSRQFMMELVVKSLKWVLIITVATTFALGSSSIHQLLTDDMPRTINQLVTNEDEGPEDTIDDNLQQMEAAMVAIDALYTSFDETLQAAKTRTMWFTGVGVAGPSLMGGAILLMYKMAMALFVGFGPFFILCLGFEQTKGMFQKWVWYGIGTMFSLAVLSFTVSMISKLLGAVAGAYVAQYLVALAAQASPQGVSSMAMQQGGLGLLMTLFLVTVPPMAAAFFQGTVGQFMAYNAFGQGQAMQPTRPGGGYVPASAEPAANASTAINDPARSHRPAVG
ncbi:type IV secretion system protein [Pseudoxanthomonas sp. LjRoot143]|uniref:type IV secretion system protein n=1 Tax=Pseudoxanthomonas sp. LjRoot143 TaxID=3342266 RepID=UPI003ED07281